MIRFATLLAAAFTVGLAYSASADEQAVAYVINEDAYSIDEPLAEAGDAARGEAVVRGRTLGNCLACHVIKQLADVEQFHGLIGPELSEIGSVYSVEELRLRVANSRFLNEDSIMPAFLKVDGLNNVSKNFVGKSILTPQEVEDVVAYLATLK